MHIRKRFLAVAVTDSEGGGLNYCQSAYKTTTAGQWKAIASDVLDGTHFTFEYKSSAASTGRRAH